MASKPDKRLPKDMQSALKAFPKIVKQKEDAAREKEKVLKNFMPFSRKLLKMTKKNEKKVTHPWRLCPAGQHWVASHPMNVPVSEKNPTGVTVRDGHCRTNRSGKDQIYSDEIHRIAENFFSQVADMPAPDDLGYKGGNRYDRLIGGWTLYWNEIFDPLDRLSPNLVKALIMTESRFKEDARATASPGNLARGLMQITDQTLKILSDERGELKDFLIDIDQREAFDPNLNISAGVRWLFHKKNLLEKKLRRKVSWEEAVMEYKSYTKDLKMKKKKALKQRDKFLDAYEKLNK